MFRKCFLATLALAIFACASSAFAQTGELRGKVVMQQADGQTVPVGDAVVEVFRTDVQGKYPTKTNKKGEFVFAGLPYIGTYIIAVSHPTAQPAWLTNVKAGRQIDYLVTMSPGDGKRLTLEEIRAAIAQGGGTTGEETGVSAEEKAKRAEVERKNAEIIEKNKKIQASNEIVTRTFKAGNEALIAKNYDEAIRQYDEGLAADPEQTALVSNKALAVRQRGVDRYNAAITAKDDAAKASGLETAKADFKMAAELSGRALELLKAQTTPTEPAELARYNANKLSTLSARAESMRLFVTKADASQVDAGQKAYEEYIAAESDPVKKAKGQHDLAQMLFDANSFDKALAQYQKILETNPDDLDALLRSGQALFNIGAINNDKTKYQEAANYLARFVEKAPDSNSLKADAQAILEALKDQENVKPDKAPAPTRRRRP